MRTTIYEDADSGGCLELVTGDLDTSYLAGAIVVDASEKGAARPKLLAATVEIRSLMPSITRPLYQWVWLEQRKESEWTLSPYLAAELAGDLAELVLDGERVVIYGLRDTGNTAVMAILLLEAIEPEVGDPIMRMRAIASEKSIETTGQAKMVYSLLGTPDEFQTCDGYWSEVAAKNKVTKLVQPPPAQAAKPTVQEERIWQCDNCGEYFDDTEVTLYKSTTALAGCKADGCAGTCKPVSWSYSASSAARNEVQLTEATK